jgi:hypothetical protein
MDSMNLKVNLYETKVTTSNVCFLILLAFLDNIEVNRVFIELEETLFQELIKSSFIVLFINTLFLHNTRKSNNSDAKMGAYAINLMASIQVMGNQDLHMATYKLKNKLATVINQPE